VSGATRDRRDATASTTTHEDTIVKRYDQELISIPNVARVAARKYGDSVAIIDDDLQWTFEDVQDRMLDAVRAFLALGLKPGDRVALCGPNSALWVQAALGILGSGGVLVPLNTRFKGPEYAHVLRKSGARALVTVGSFLGNDYVDMMREAAPDAPALQEVIVLDDAVIEGTTTFTDFLANGRGVSLADAHGRIDNITSEDLSDVIFTSGTTGAPKGVMLKHGASIRAFGWLTDVFTFTHGDVFPVVPPFFHTFGYKNGWLGSLIHGVTMIPMRTFEPGHLLDVVEKYRATLLVGPPTLFVDMMNHPSFGDRDVSSLRFGVPSAATVPMKLIEDMRNVMGFDIVLNAYALTEATALVSTCRPEDDPEIVATTVGRAADDVEVVIADDAGNHLPPGHEGEVWVRGYLVMEGYWQEPEETARTITPDGYLKTGDIGVLDEQGYLRITDRKKDMFIVGGFNAYPAEIEACLARLDKILHVAVVGAPDDRMGEVGVAFVVPKPGVTVSEDEVKEFARQNLANFKVPRSVVIVDDLPRNASMKVRKDILRQQLAASR
jgi:acyl-CoA synthetase (AMP-forming)/AMP-acid ligase II